VTSINMTPQPTGAVGVDHPMQDAVDRVVGSIRFTIDHEVGGMAHARVIRSPFPHARLTGIDVKGALALPGVLAVLTGEDIVGDERIPNPCFGVARRDQWPLAVGKVRYAGDPVALVVADTERHADAAAIAVRVDYDELPYVVDAAEAAREGAPVIHEEWPRNECGSWALHHGDVEEGFAQADRIVESVYTSPSANPVPLEPHVAVAQWNDQLLQVWSSTQWPSIVRRELAHMFGLAEHLVEVRTYPLGGGFGAKGQVKIEPLVASAARIVGVPVRLELDRDEVFLTVAKHPATIRVKSGVKRDGTFVARDMELVYAAGAYAVTSPSGTGNALVRAPGPYRIPNIRITSQAYYTNTVPGGSFRGAFTNQVAFAYESHVDEIASELGMDPMMLRMKNLLRDGDTYATGEAMHDVHFEELVVNVAEGIGWDEAQPPMAPGRLRAKGLAVILKSTPTPSRSEARVEIGGDGHVTVYSSAVDMGQGASSTLAQLAAEFLGVRYADVRVVDPDTSTTPFDTMTAGSRTTFSSGSAIRQACAALIEAIGELGADQLGLSPAELAHDEGHVVAAMDGSHRRSYGEVIVAAGLSSLSREGVFQSESGGAFKDPLDVKGMASIHWHQGAAAVEIEVDIETGRVIVLRCHGASWAGRIVNPTRVRQQNEGNIIFGIGPALFEQLEMESGQVINPNMSDYMIPSILDVPEHMTSTALVSSEADAELHGVGEMTIPAVAPAIANAVFRATGVRIRDLPLTAERVLRGLRSVEGKVR